MQNSIEPKREKSISERLKIRMNCATCKLVFD